PDRQRLAQHALALWGHPGHSLTLGAARSDPEVTRSLQWSNRPVEGRAVEPKTLGEPAQGQRSAESGGDEDRQLGRGQPEPGEGARVHLRDRPCGSPQCLARAIADDGCAQARHLIGTQRRHWGNSVYASIGAVNVLEYLGGIAIAGARTAYRARTSRRRENQL